MNEDQGHGETEAEAQVLAGLRFSFALSLVILVVEAVGAWLSHSLSVTVDAVHNVPDVIAFALSWTALVRTGQGVSSRYTFGTHRLEVFAGVANASIVLAAGGLFAAGSLLSLMNHSTFDGTIDAVWILAAAVPTLGLRAASVVRLTRIPGAMRSLNLASVVVHLGSDLLITSALLVDGAVLLLFPAWIAADAVTALIIAAILVYESVPLFRDAWEVLTERTPRHLSLEEIMSAALAVPGVAGVHDVHVWSVCPTLVCMTAHVRIRDMTVSESGTVVAKLRQEMASRFGILHAVFELEAEAPASGATAARSR